ncbi:MAG: GDSL-like Lipase/Acylhydrolase [Thermoleophilia bacterium]|nr:GDSL-like Lipase/Acylhydrolase [Thermoleophilia bacterium]
MEVVTDQQLLLLGDSLLAEISWRRTATIEQRLGPGWMTLNSATSGFTAEQSLRQAAHHARIRPTAVLVSLGTNDAAPDRGVEVESFERNLHELLAAFAEARLLLLLPPGMHDPGVDAYRDAASRIATRSGAATIDGRALAERVAEAGEAPFVEDGVHLTDAMYTALADELHRLLR